MEEINKQYLYCKEGTLPKRMCVKPAVSSAKESSNFKPDEVFRQIVGGYKYLLDRYSTEEYETAEFLPCGKEYTLDKDGNKQYLQEGIWENARQYIVVTTKEN